MNIGLQYKNNDKIFEECTAGQIPFLKYPLFSRTGIVKHGFSTRLGGVSKGCFSSMNLSFSRGDREEDVHENYRRMAAAIGVSAAKMTASRQTHTTNVRIVTEVDAGRAESRLEKLLENKWKSLKDDPQGKMKLIRFALGRGYGYEEVSSLLGKVCRND